MILRALIAALLAALLFAASAFASSAVEPLARAELEYSSIEIYAAPAGFSPGGTTEFVIRHEVRAGWHVFWVNPGDAGLPLSLDWSLPAGFAAGPVLHPSPEYIPVGPLASYAHEGAPLFRVSVSAPKDVAPGEVDVAIDAAWQTCEEICVPEEARLEFALPVGPQQPEADAGARALLSEARAAAPRPHDGAARLEIAGDAMRLVLADWSGGAARDAFFFPEREGLTTPAAPQRFRREDGALVGEFERGWTAPSAGGDVSGVLSYTDESGAPQSVSLTATVEKTPPAAAARGGAARLLVLAFLGGLILNAMPCVFPILFIKAAALMEAARKAPAAARRHGLFYTAGVVATFAALGALLLLLRAGGEGLGWGFHLQSPLVVGLSAYVLLAVGLNLSGVFTIGAGLAGAGAGLAGREGAAGAFFTGALAVLVAAPCVGPLLSAPMGAALLQPPAIGMLIFIVMAIGLAAPYLALGLAPRLGRFLPKPGRWMETFKQALAFPVFAAAAYFLWVFARQTGDGALAAILAGAVLIAFSAWTFEASRGEGARALIVRAVSALALVGAVAPLLRIEAADAAGTSGDYGAIAAEPYSDETLASYRAAGETIFIDFTAAWCVTCQVNKLTVLKSDAVADAFARTDARLLVADWTVRDPAVTAALQRYGASGVPLYVVYRGEGEGMMLPVTLTRRAVIDALGADQG